MTKFLRFIMCLIYLGSYTVCLTMFFFLLESKFLADYHSMFVTNHKWIFDSATILMPSCIYYLTYNKILEKI